MLSFTNPWYLLLLVTLPPLFWWNHRRRRSTLSYPLTAQLRDLTGRRVFWARWGGLFLRALSLLLLVLALVGPRWPDERSRIQTQGIALVFVVDVSQSMSAKDFSWDGVPISRLSAARRVFRLLIEGGTGPGGRSFSGRPADLVGLVSFAARPETVCPLTLSHSAVFQLLDSETPREIAGDSHTNLSDALVLALNRLREASPKHKVLILLSDGQQTESSPVSQWQPLQIAGLASSLKIPIYTIDAGPTVEQVRLREGNEEAQARALGIETLDGIAQVSGGRAYSARDTDTLFEAFQAIDQLERSLLTSHQYRRYHEAYPWLALASFAFLILLRALELTIWRRLPG